MTTCVDARSQSVALLLLGATPPDPRRPSAASPVALLPTDYRWARNPNIHARAEL